MELVVAYDVALESLQLAQQRVNGSEQGKSDARPGQSGTVAVAVVVVTVGSRPKRVEPSGQLAEQ